MDLSSESQFLDSIKTALSKDELKLPTLPEVALKVRQAVGSGRATDSDIAKLVATDPGLSVRLLQVANSPLFRSRQKIDSVQVAITRLGHNTIRNLVTSLAMKQLFKPSSRALEKYFQETWQQSVNVASISRALAMLRRPLDPDQAMLGGLLHQIGKLPMLTLADKYPEALANKERFESHLQSLHPEIGRLIMETWDLPDDLKKVPAEYLDYQRVSGTSADYVDVVQVAYLENLMSTNPECGVDLSTVPAFAKLGLDPQIEVVDIEGVADEVNAAQQVIG